MFEYLFPIFAFGVVITAIVAKGVLAAAEVARAERISENQTSSRPEATKTARGFPVQPARAGVANPTS